MKRSLLLIAVLGSLAMPAAAEPYVAEHTQPHVTTADIDAQVRANIAAARASYADVARRGGCNADIIPVTIAAYCWDESPNPTGGPLGASAGGSD